MGLFDKFKKAVSAEPAAPATPAAITAQASDFALCAPVSGKAIKMADVPDPVFSGEVLARGARSGPRTTWCMRPCLER